MMQLSNMTRNINLNQNSTIHNWFFDNENALAPDLLVDQDHLQPFLAFTLSDIDSFDSFIIFHNLLPSNLRVKILLLTIDDFFSNNLIYLGNITNNLLDDLFPDHVSQVVLTVKLTEVSHQLLSRSHCAVAKAANILHHKPPPSPLSFRPKVSLKVCRQIILPGE